ncbi:hypothetical protein AMJ86_02375 [bacterium SM23_57]|nr:MAG: hypothetical protein AMJ86_02375 [bacterium SM23_57]
MQILHRGRNNVSTIYLDGTLDWEGIQQLEFFLDRSLEFLRDRVVLNLSDMHYMDPQCLEYLVDHIAKIRDCGWDIALTVLDVSDHELIPDLAITDLILEYPDSLSHLIDLPLLEMNLPG